ncbi:MAG: spermine synthase [Opitutales bacterium]
MKPQLKIAEAASPDGKRLTLHTHDGHFSLRVEGKELMHSAVSASEKQLGEIAASRIAGLTAARVLIGGLGLGFTLQSVLAGAGPHTTVCVAELIPEVIAWNRTHLAGLNGTLLDDPRVTVVAANVCDILGQAAAGLYDVILLDIDNGPTAMVHAGNARLYDRRGIERIVAALKPGGRVAIWSAKADSAFSDRLFAAGLMVQPVPAKRHVAARHNSYIIYVADKAAA